MDLNKVLQNKNILVAGLGKSGIAVLRMLYKKGFNVSGCDNNNKIKEKQEIKELIDQGIKIHIENNFENLVNSSDFIILSPGIDQRNKIYEKARQNNKIVTGELETAWSFMNIPVVAITGTNGKSTVTELVSDMLEASKKRVFKGGNLGNPLSNAVLNQNEYDIAVVEVSSFQIDTTINFAPNVGLLLNTTPDHLDRYNGFEGYIHSKLSLFKNQTSDHAAVLNSLENHKINKNPKLCFFNADKNNADSAIAENNCLIINFKGFKKTIDIKNFSLKGLHNLENLSAAAITALEAGADYKGIETSINRFQGLPHRMEHCGNIKDIEFIDDSKATNPDSVLKAIQGLNKKISLIMGGKDKGYNYNYLEKAVNEKVTNLILIGEARDKIKKQVNFQGTTLMAESMEDAVEKAYTNLDSGYVLLSPACSSFDMFTSYGHRGDVFQKAVIDLKEKRAL